MFFFFLNGVSRCTPNPLVTVIIIFPRTSMTWSFWGMPHVRHISFCHHRCRKDPLTLTSTKSRTCAFSPSWRVVLKLVPGLDQHHQRWQVSICSLIKGVWSAVAVIFQTYYRTPGDVQFVQNETRDDFAKRSGKISSLMVKQSNITSTGFDWNRAPWFQWSIIISFLKNDHILVIKLNVFESFSDKAVCHRRTHTHIQGSSQNWLPGKTIEGKPKEFHAKNQGRSNFSLKSIHWLRLLRCWAAHHRAGCFTMFRAATPGWRPPRRTLVGSPLGHWSNLGMPGYPMIFLWWKSILWQFLHGLSNFWERSMSIPDDGVKGTYRMQQVRFPWRPECQADFLQVHP